MPDQVVELRNAYEWAPSDGATIEALIAAVRSLVGNDFTFRFRIDFSGKPERSITYSDEQAFLSATTSRMRSFWIGGYGSGRNLGVSWNSPGSLDVSVSDPDEAFVRKVLSDFEQRLNLLGRPAADRPTYFIEGLYAFLSPPGPEWFEALLPVLRRLSGASEYSGGEIRDSGTPHLRRGLPDPDGWLEAVNAVRETTIEWSLQFTGDQRHLRLNYTKDRSQLRVSVKSPVEKEVNACFKEIEGRQGVVAVNNFISPEQSRGRFRRFFLKQEAQPVWLDRFVGLTAALTGPRFSFTGKFRTLPPERLEFSYGNLQVWRGRLDKEWPTLSSVSCWLAGPAGSINMDLDLRRDLLGLNLQTNTNEDLAALFRQLQNTLDLSEATEAPYKYRRFGRLYKIGGWTQNAKFADAVRNAVKIAFQDRVPALERAYVARGGPQEAGDSFYDLEALDKALRATDDYSRANLVFEGTNGKFLGVHLEQDRTQLSLLANLDRSVFSDVVTEFRNALDDLELKSQDDDTRKEAKGSNTPALIAAGAGIIGAGLAFFAAGPVMGWLREAPKLRIVEPLKPADGKAVMLSDGGFDVRWQHTEPTFRSGDRVRNDWMARVAIQRYGDGQVVLSTPIEKGNFHVDKLAAGDYLLSVATPEGLQDEAHVTVPAAPGDATKRQ